MRRVLLIVVLLAGCAEATGAKTVLERAKDDNVTEVATGDPAMEAAFAKARASLDGFLKLEKDPPPQLSAFSVKVGIEQDGYTEFFWLSDLEETASGYSAIIDNQPERVDRVRMGQRYAFARDEIVDWTYRDDQRQASLGNFTGCALLSHEPPEQAEAFKREFGLSCD
ncbi:YegJ family protein [Lysobacter sp. cf310]|uniref:YegJ family protein n=1 Tax=Lysobacter sp. cf310 TaxID=1761790 RepID=UPI0008EB6C14|nr:DUF2314 domain-containing protein [Lysobacter sp. cf310]SFK31481.1 Uncharacterized conserved protein YegJ, DUF2314 family [Lysobacter sp. cf310]